jgi:hypothetical protein
MASPSDPGSACSTSRRSDTVTFATGRCLDRIVADGDVLRFRSRRVDILQVLPL